MKFWMCAVLALVLVVPGVWAAEADNPMYQSWSKFKVGAMAKYQQISEMMGNKTESEIIYTLVELTPEKAVVEMSGSTTVAGNKMEMPKTRMEHAAKLNVDGAAASAAAPVNADTKQGAEEIDAAGGKIKCTTVETNITQGESVITSKVWSSEDVPGTLVKSVNSMEKPMKTTTTLTLIEMKKP